MALLLVCLFYAAGVNVNELLCDQVARKLEARKFSRLHIVSSWTSRRSRTRRPIAELNSVWRNVNCVRELRVLTMAYADLYFDSF